MGNASDVNPKIFNKRQKYFYKPGIIDFFLIFAF